MSTTTNNSNNQQQPTTTTLQLAATWSVFLTAMLNIKGRMKYFANIHHSNREPTQHHHEGKNVIQK